MQDDTEAASGGPTTGATQASKSPTVGPSALPTQAAIESPSLTAGLPATIGRYKILRKLGEGGMGVVYEAEQQHPRRRVAIKIVHGGRFVDEARVKMFQREADTLARLEHANIASIFESGRTEDGQHFFAMELVKGDTLDRYLSKRLTAATKEEIRHRLGLLRKIADAVHYAHQRGVIHRDLKPSNVIVIEGSTREGSTATGTLSGPRLPEIKILDFGLARITEGDIAAATQVTEVGVIKGTLAYMSPEQARGASHDIDVRADVYALGVMLYEMLTGSRPYDVTKTSLVDAVRRICEQPPKPLKQNWSGVRKIDPDIETIVGKALEKDADRRYASASALSEDIARHLALQPILARPPSTVYQLRKFAARNRVLVGGVLATFLVLVAGIVVSTMFGLREAAQRRQATWDSYVANIAAAESNLRQGSFGQAKRRLSQCPSQLRGWEWFHLEARLDRSLATLAGHDNVVRSVAFDPSGRRIASGSWDKTVRVWDVATGEMALTLRGHEGGVTSVAFDPSGKRIASGSRDNTVRVWDAASGELLATLRGHEDRVHSVVFSPDGKRIASGSRDKTVRVWDSASGEPALTLRGHEHVVSAVAFSPDGSRIVSGSFDKTLRLWDAASGELAMTLRGDQDPVTSVAFSPDGSRIVSGSFDNTLRVWDAASGKLAATLRGHQDVVSSAAFSPEGRRIASGSEDRTVRVWDATTGEMLATMLGHDAIVWSVAFSPDGTRIASGSSDKTVKLWDATSCDRLIPPRGTESPVRSVALSPDGARLVSGSEDGSVRLWDVASGEMTARLTGPGIAFTVAFSADGTRIAAGFTGGTVWLWDAATGESLLALQAHGPIAFSPDGTQIASGSRDTSLKLWDTTSGELLKTFGAHGGRVESIAFSADGSRVLSGSADGTVRMWDTVSGEELMTLRGHDAGVWSVALSPDGTRIASGSSDSTVRVWDAKSGELLSTLSGHDGIVYSVAYSPDGTRIASGSLDKTVGLWDTASGDLVVPLTGHGGPVFSVAFSRDGTRIASGSGDGSVRLWNSVPEQATVPETAAAKHKK